jgi:hypothetical protein
VTGVEALVAETRSRGVVFEDYGLPDFTTVEGVFTSGPFTAAWFEDADGNTIEISDVAAVP